MKEFVEIYKRVIDFNTKAGVKDHPFDTAEWWKSIDLQTKLLVEESTEAYEAAIGITDTGILKRNHLFARRSSAVIASFYNSNKKFLDFAGGYGIFVRMMRDFGFDF